jgi:hypothetical protein
MSIHTPAQGMVLARDALRRGDNTVKAAFLKGFEMRGEQGLQTLTLTMTFLSRSYMDPIELLKSLDDSYWRAAFREGLRCGAMRDRHYHPIEDREFLLMWCGV